MRFLLQIAILSAVCVGVCLAPNPQVAEAKDIECVQAKITMDNAVICEQGYICKGSDHPTGQCKTLKLPMPVGYTAYCCD